MLVPGELAAAEVLSDARVTVEAEAGIKRINVPLFTRQTRGKQLDIDEANPRKTYVFFEAESIFKSEQPQFILHKLRRAGCAWASSGEIGCCRNRGKFPRRFPSFFFMMFLYETLTYRY